MLGLMTFATRNGLSRALPLIGVLVTATSACGGDDGAHGMDGESGSSIGTTTGGSSPTSGSSLDETSGTETADGTAEATSSSETSGTDDGSSGSTDGSGTTGSESSDDTSGETTSDTGETGNPDAPGPVIDLRALPSNASVYVLWTMPSDPDLDGVLVARAVGEPVDGVPVDGTSYGPGETIGNAEVVFASDGLNLLDSPLQNGTTYHYRAWAFDLDLNYSVGSADHAIPQDALPTSLTSHEAPVGGQIGAVRLAFDGSEQPHAALRVDAGGSQWQLRYATCDSGCDAPSDWQIALVDTAPSNSPDIALDVLGRPRIAYPRSGATYFARCDNNCGVGGNWSNVALPGTTAGTTVIDVDANGRTWIVGGTGQLEISWCDNGCTNGANWTTITRAGSYFYKHELQHTSTSDRLLVVSRYDANYSTRILRCSGACEDPDDWSEEVVGNTSGSVYPLRYRFTADEEGARTLFPYDGRYGECEDCAPSLPPVLYQFTSTEIYYAGFLQLSAKDQTRMFVRHSSGAMNYLLCDYDCGKPTSWIVGNALLPSSEVLAGFEIGSDGMPIGVGHAYSNPTGLRLYRGVAP
jgi:hypothetical protein